MSRQDDLKAAARKYNAETPRHRAPEEWPSRREFLKTAGAAAGVIGGISYLWLAPKNWPLGLRDETGDAGKPGERRIKLKDYRVDPPSGSSMLGVAHGQDYRAMLRMAIAAIGGIEHYIKHGDIVLIKPNVAFDRAPKLAQPRTLRCWRLSSRSFVKPAQRKCAWRIIRSNRRRVAFRRPASVTPRCQRARSCICLRRLPSKCWRYPGQS